MGLVIKIFLVLAIIYIVIMVIDKLTETDYQKERKTNYNKLLYHSKFKADGVSFIGGTDTKFNDNAFMEILVNDEGLVLHQYCDYKIIEWNKVGVCRKINVDTERGISFSRFVTLGIFSLIGSKKTKIKTLIELNYKSEFIEETIFIKPNNKTDELLKEIYKMKS